MKKAGQSAARKGGQSAAQKRLADQLAAAAAARATAARRKRLLMVAVPIILVVALVAVLIVVKVASGAGSPKSGTAASAAASDVITAVTAVPATALNTVGVGSATGVPKAITATALTQDGKPRVLYIGAEYCPYCAAERWAMVVALSRFGTFTNLGQTTSSPSDVYPSTPTLSFHGATFTGTTLAFTGVEQQSNQVVNGKYAPLDTLSAADQVILKTYDGPPYFTSAGSIPFIDIGGKYLVSGASYDPQVLQGKTAAQIAAALSDPTTAIAKAVLGTANLITAAICATSTDQPATVCQAAGVQAATAKLTSSG